MTDTDASTTQALIVRPSVLPSLAQFGIERDLAIRLASARGFLPDHYFTGDGVERAAKVLAAIEYGRAVGIEPMIALQNITMIKGKAGASAMLIGAQLRRAGYKITTSWYDQQGVACGKEMPGVWGCKITLSKNGEVTGDGVFSLTDAQRAGLIKADSGWANYPKDMLYARALTQAAREGAQDAVLGMAYTGEELGVETDYDGNVDTVRLPPAVVDQPVVLDGVIVPGQEAVQSSAGVQAAPSPDVVVAEAKPIAQGPVLPEQAKPDVAASGATPPPVNVMPLSGPALARRMGAGRSIGPAARRTNVITAPQAAETPATLGLGAPRPSLSADPVPSQPAPLGLTDDLLDAAPVDDGLSPMREDLRKSAAELAHVNAILHNKVKVPMENVKPVDIPPATPSEASETGLRMRIDQDFPGRTLANLGAAEIHSILERFEASLSKKRAQMVERGITEE
jgi:hypothetical protein